MMKPPTSAFQFKLGQEFEERMGIYRTIFSSATEQSGLYLQSSLFSRRIMIVPENLTINSFELTKVGGALNLSDNLLDFVVLQGLPWGRREIFLLKELFRVLKDGGTLFLLIKNLPVRIFLKAIFAALSSTNYRTLLLGIGFRNFDSYMAYPSFSRTIFLIPLQKQAVLLAGLNFIRNHPKGTLGQVKDLIMLALAKLRILPFLVTDQALIVTK